MDQNTSVSTSPSALVYDGRIGDLYRIFLLNILLTILTLGIFRFWAITRYRRYLWSRTRFQGERFEYTGTGGELFVGYLLAGLVLIGGGIAAAVASVILRKFWAPLAGLPPLLFFVWLVALTYGAIFSAQRYRLTRTAWCGIRGGMTGSMLGYGLRAVGYALLAVITFFQTVPWIQVRLAEKRINASSFGNAAFRFHGRAGQLYLTFLLTFLANIALFFAAMVTLWLVIWMLDLNLSQVPAGQAQLAAKLGWGVVGGMYAAIIASVFIRAWYIALFERHVAGNTVLSGLHFASSMTGSALFRQMLGNALIIIFTVGIGYPITLHRNARFLARTLRVEGRLDPGALKQNAVAAPRFGEGMFQQLDAGGVI